jgi:hypothetical protein
VTRQQPASNAVIESSLTVSSVSIRRPASRSQAAGQQPPVPSAAVHEDPPGLVEDQRAGHAPAPIGPGLRLKGPQRHRVDASARHGPRPYRPAVGRTAPM